MITTMSRSNLQPNLNLDDGAAKRLRSKSSEPTSVLYNRSPSPPTSSSYSAPEPPPISAEDWEAVLSGDMAAPAAALPQDSSFLRWIMDAGYADGDGDAFGFKGPAFDPSVLPPPPPHRHQEVFLLPQLPAQVQSLPVPAAAAATEDLEPQAAVDELLEAARRADAGDSTGAREILARLNHRLPSPLAPPGHPPLLRAAALLRDPLLRLLLPTAVHPMLQNHAGWTPLQEAPCLGCKDIAAFLLRAHRLAAWTKLRRRVPALSAALGRVQDFYLEVDFHFESSVVPLLSRAAPSDTYPIWKRDADLRADTTLAGFDGLRIRRADHSFLFFGEEADADGRRLPPGSLLAPHRGKREVHDAFAATAASGDEDAVTSDAAAYRPGLNISSVRLVPRTTWLRKEKTESVGEWKARVFDVHNVVFSFRTLKAASAGRKDFTFELAGDDDGEFLPLEIWDDDEDGDFLVADIAPPPPQLSCYVPGRRSVAGPPSHMGTPQRRRNSVDVPRRLPTCALVGRGEDGVFGHHATTGGAKWKEEETVKTLRPTVWLTEDFPLSVDEFLPLLDILATRVCAVRRLRELLTTKFSPGTFPVKVAIPVVPTVRVVITFTKFVPLIKPEEFFTPMSSPSLSASSGPGSIMPKPDTHKSSYLRWTSKNSRAKPVNLSQVADNTDPFTISSDYT